MVIYMKKKNVRLLCLQGKRPLTRDTLQFDNVFRILEPVIGKINERTEAQPTYGLRSEWFRVYRVCFTLLSPLLSALLSAEHFDFRTSSCPWIRMTCYS